MRLSYHVDAADHDQACRLLEALCEGCVQAMLLEFEGAAEGTFPCCIKCAGMRTRNAPMTPAQADSIYETLEHGHPVTGMQRHMLANILYAHGYEEPEVNPAGHVAHRLSTQVAPASKGQLEWSTYVGSRNPAPIRIRSASELVHTGEGSTLELACYQCAMKRREGADPHAKVIVCCTVPGTFRGAVLMSDDHKNPEKRGRIDDPVVDARPIGGCACEPR